MTMFAIEDARDEPLMRCEGCQGRRWRRFPIIRPPRLVIPAQDAVTGNLFAQETP